MTAPPKDGISVVVASRTPAPAELIGAWEEYLRASGRPWQVLSVADARGTGAAVRATLPHITQPLVLLTSDDYPYTPSDLAKLLERIDTPGEMPDPTTGEWKPRAPDLVAGHRTGVPEPLPLRAWGSVVRTFARLVLSYPMEAPQGWYGWGEAWRNWVARSVYGVPVYDPHAAFKLVRRELLERFPIQCDGDLFHVELVAKATFLTCMMDDLPLTPKPDKVQPAVWDSADKKVLWGKPKFKHPPVEPDAPLTPNPAPADGEGDQISQPTSAIP